MRQHPGAGVLELRAKETGRCGSEGWPESGGCVRAGVGLPSTAVAGATLVTDCSKEKRGTELQSRSHWHSAS